MTERLDRIEAALEQVVQIQTSQAQDIDAIIGALSSLDTYAKAAAEAGQRTDARLDQLTNIVASNSQQIASNSQQIASNSQQIASNAQQIAEHNQRFASLVERIDENNQRFNILIEEARADRAEWRSRFGNPEGEQN